MNRRRFVELLAKTAAISTVAYSFPSVIRPQNIVVVPSYDEWMAQQRFAASLRSSFYILDNGGWWPVRVSNFTIHRNP